MTAGELCSNCGKTIRIGKAGSLTQWIFTDDSCDCQKKQFQEVPIGDNRQPGAQICELCGKEKGDARLGSLTHWVFSSDRCRCMLDTSIEIHPFQSNNEISSPFIPDFEPEFIKRLEQGAIDYHGLASDSFPFSRYRIVAVVGRGGSGVVYDVWDCLLKKRVAIKTMGSQNWSSEELMRFQSEARIASRLGHANILQTYDFGASDNGQPYMVMEFVNGKNLAQIISAESRLELDEALPMFIKMCEGVAYAHKAGLFHRDLKPSNIMIAHRDRNDDLTVKVIDFGIAAPAQAHTIFEERQAGTIEGSPAYMSADQIQGLQFDERSDIYSIGCLMFETICGVLPFSSNNAMATLSLHATAEIPCMRDVALAPDEISDSFERIVRRCLEKDRSSRYQSVDELVMDLRAELDLQRRLSPSKKMGEDNVFESKGADKNPALSKAALTFLLVALVGVGFVLIKSMINWQSPTNGSTGSVELYDDITPAPPRAKKNADDPFESLAERNTIIKYIPKSNTLTVDGVGSADKILETAVTSGKRIEHFELYGMSVTDKGLKALSRLDSLRELHICDLTVDNESSWLIIGDCVNLTQIRFTDGEVTDAFLKRIGSLPYLRRLELDACSVSAKGLSYLVNSKITYLSLKVTPLTAKHVDEIVKLKRLLCLFLGDTGITDSDVMRFTELPYLVTLGINGTPVTDSTLLSLNRLAYLRVVYGFRCQNLTPAGIARFKKQNRKVQFINDEDDVSRAFVPH